jgi:acyl-CoA thioesterase-2
MNPPSADARIRKAADPDGGFADLFALDIAGPDRFRARRQDHGVGRIFGGLVIAQALMAADRTLEGRPCHSLHARFLRQGDLRIPVTYDVGRLLDGGSFSARTVVASQDGRAILHMTASFHAPETGFEHESQEPVRRSPPPAEPSGGPPSMIADLLEFRTVEASVGGGAAHKLVAMRARRPIGPDPTLRRSVLAYASDLAFMEPALLPHGLSFDQPGFQGASLDHTLWFHRTPAPDEWFQFSQHSPWAGGGRGLVQGSISDGAGHLLASVTQECLMRIRHR